MKTLTTPAATAPTTLTTALPAPLPTTAGTVRRGPSRRLIAAGAVASLAMLGACTSGEGSGGVGTETVASGSSTGSTGGSTAGGTTPATTPANTATSATTAVAPARTDKKVAVTITDTVLGHDIKVTKLSRNIPWPAGNPVAAASFEIVGVELTVDAGDRYSADVQPTMFTLKTTTPALVIKPTAEFAKKLGAPLATAKRAEKKSGWLFFKVDRGVTGPVALSFNRPAYKVSTTGKDIKAASAAKVIG